MLEGALTIQHRDEEMILLKERALYLTKYNALLIADLHIGKLTHFRKSGIGLPDQGEAANFLLLAQLLNQYQPHTCFFMGDLFHSQYNVMWEYLTDFLEEYPQINFVLVGGNHDILDDYQYQKTRMEVVDSYTLGNLILTHEPHEVELPMYNLCGHLHPGVRLVGKGKQKLRLPCFFMGQDTGILPAFGSFTGLSIMQPKEEDKVYVITMEEVIKI